MEDDTALSIIDPLNLNLDINKESTLEVLNFTKLHILESQNDFRTCTFLGTFASSICSSFVQRYENVHKHVELSTETVLFVQKGTGTRIYVIRFHS